MYVYICMYVCMYVCVCVRTYVCIYVYTYMAYIYCSIKDTNFYPYTLQDMIN
jgi:hypothetical protein